ncbi:MAG: hypothetical protein M3076_12690 [Actinomycetota bacterium]|nr:hypothetical protein [Actinomycetota bacterium]
MLALLVRSRARLVAGIIIAAVALLGGGFGLGRLPASGARSQSARSQAPLKFQLLFVVRGATAFASVKRSQAQATLTLEGVSPHTLVFSDRPVRLAEWVRTASLFASWSRVGFSATPPNAALIVPGGPAGHQPTAVEMLHPRYDRARQRLVVTLSSLDGPGLSWLRRMTPAGASHHGEAALFIDPLQISEIGVRLSVGGGSGSGSSSSTTLTGTQLPRRNAQAVASAIARVLESMKSAR